jgi:hypothetical protein
MITMRSLNRFEQEETERTEKTDWGESLCYSLATKL